jgi:hypothetical protein
MIRTLIEVTGENDWEHKQKLEKTLGLLGFEPKPSEDQVHWRRDLYEALEKRGLDPRKLVEDLQAERVKAG